MVEFPDDWFTPPIERPDTWPDYPEVRAAIDWIKTYIPEDQWVERRLAAANRLYEAAIGTLVDPSGLGRFFNDRDQTAWVLFLGEAYLDHNWNYEPMYGARIIAVFQAIGRQVVELQAVPGIQDRMNRLVGAERSQPNGALFELIVAAAYLREGFTVEFVPERPDQRTHDLNVTKNGVTQAVECKRMETGEQGERERQLAREIWARAAPLIVESNKSAFCNVTYLVVMEDIPNNYLRDKIRYWLRTGNPNYFWTDEFGRGSVGEPDLNPLSTELLANTILIASNRFIELVTGSYEPRQNIIQLVRCRYADWNPRYMSECDIAVVLKWKCMAEGSISAKARDVLRKISDANDQLPNDRPGIIHIGLEAIDEIAVEILRASRIERTTGGFDPADKPLKWIYVHHFAPESPPDISFHFDETTQWRRIGHHNDPLPIGIGRLITGEDDQYFEGGHWERPFDEG